MGAVRDLAEHFVAATQAAAVAADWWRGRGDGNAADGAAVEAMRAVFDNVPFDGRVAIGEGERDDAPMLWIGEPLGSRQGDPTAVQVDIAVDPLECTNHVATDSPNAIAVLAAAPRGALLHAPDCYMDKIAGSSELKGHVSLDMTVEENIEAAAAALDKQPSEMKVVVMERDRHRDLISRLRALEVPIRLIGDGDVAAAIHAADPAGDVDLLLGIGAAPEGVISAAAIRGFDGVFEGRLVCTTDDHRERAAQMLGDEVDRKWGRDDLCSSSDALFVASGICPGYLPGVTHGVDGISVTSEIIDVHNGSRRRIESLH